MPFYFPPFHPNCRCTVIAIRNIQEYARQRFVSGRPESIVDDNVYSSLDVSRFEGLPVSVPESSSAIPPAPLPVYVGFGSLEQIKSYYASILPNLKLDMANMPVPVIIDIMEQFEELRLDNPELAGNLEEIVLEKGRTSNGTKNALSWATDDGTSIVLNSDYWKTEENIKQIVDECKSIGVFVNVPSSEVKQVMTHEIGHVLYSQLSSDQRRDLAKLFRTLTPGELSLVAEQDANEMFAEAYTLLKLGGPTTSVTAGILKILSSVKKCDKIEKSSVVEFLRSRIERRKRTCYRVK